MTHRYVFAFGFGALGMSLLCILFAAMSSGNSAMTFGLVAGPFGFMGVLATLIGCALRDLSDRLTALEQKQTQTEMTASKI